MLERSFIKEGIKRAKLDSYLEKKLERGGYVSCQIQKTPVATRIVIKVERPGIVIGRKGSNVKKLTRDLEEKFGLENVQIKVEEVPVPELDPTVMSKRIARSLERGAYYRKVLHWNLRNIMRAGAQGAEIIVSGKLVGKGGKSRTERVSRGYLKKAGETSELVREAQAQAVRKAGIIGVTVRIIPPDITFPDKVRVTGEEIGNIETQGNKEDEQKRKTRKTTGTED